MSYDLVKTRLAKYREQEQDLFNGFLHRQLREEAGYTNKVKEEDSTYFNLKIKNKTYPSCYHQNLLLLAAKKLVTEENKIMQLNEIAVA